MLKDVELDIAQVVESAAIAGISMGAAPAPSLYAGPFPSAAPDRMVSVRFAGGDAEPYVADGHILFEPEVQVVVRGVPGRYRETLQLALTCFEALYLPAVDGYISIQPQGAGPDYIGPDEKGRPVFTFTVQLAYEAER